MLGSFFLIRRDALGGAWAASTPPYVMYGEEADLCRRARDAGAAAPRMTPEATIVHITAPPRRGAPTGRS